MKSSDVRVRSPVRRTGVPGFDTEGLHTTKTQQACSPDRIACPWTSLAARYFSVSRLGSGDGVRPFLTAKREYEDLAHELSCQYDLLRRRAGRTDGAE